MPKITVSRRITLDEAAEMLRQRLPQHKVMVRHGGALGSIRVERALSMANVTLSPDGEATTIRVTALGLPISRVVNQFGIARRVTEAFRAAYRPESG